MAENGRIGTSMKNWIDVFMRNSMRNMVHYARENGLSMPQMGALFQIRRKGCLGVSDIGGDLRITNPAASQMMDRLVHLNLILRSEDPQDRRGKKIELTEKGERVLRESVQAHRGWWTAIVKLLTPQEQDQVQVALDLLVEKAQLLEHSTETDG
jgi:DNA-binding MarR family transcriptional regulator